MLSGARSGHQLLREQVYTYLQEQMRVGALEPGAAIKVSKLITELGISRTPLREALLILQEQGFVVIKPQRGVVINAISLGDVKDIYEILGGIESRVFLSVFDKIGQKEITRLEEFNKEIAHAITVNDIARHNLANIQFHDVFLQLSENVRLLKYVGNLKMQLYDFPRRNYGKQWNEQNLDEHRKFLQLIQNGCSLAAADYLRDVHWEFKYPDSFTIIPS
ncbi:GntR family transcriptional regulator [Desulforhopalus sp. IMCC35007]|uniref:GntR family transcriptional regulator n=1 Tax=Desulforhopalus sp. IMCC35007 TaxID=2569543 RepID=UPI0010ADF40D|nr:GntR family transcriptional regulator [Desulforhopalus sp. IMCC35007]TKB07783.1 GntR family transcriptional regulator [Desulforhopalus sp. IMCC35007]